MSTPMSEPDPWRSAHTAARDLHDALLALGISETVLGPLTARQHPSGAMRVVVPPLPLVDVQRILTGLGPYLGPQRAVLAAPTPPAGFR